MSLIRIKITVVILILTIFLLSCGKSDDENNRIIKTIEKFKIENNRFPTSLAEINIPTDEYCCYITGESFNLEYSVGNDLYWYNSGNYSWDFLEGDADKL